VQDLPRCLYIVEDGRGGLVATIGQFCGTADLRGFYLGISAQPGRTSMKDVKHYKRRKRWLS